ncbi:hypothetical protein [Cryobacterium melibiosiphilum]|uniref:hypothetical protein n=1 Tax=Cryobacterium melibiosiphilum TaxID=995039 RepID=UPI0011C22586|nr:hypothetical protein [Cryobacterium melibiosiphilum]
MTVGTVTTADSCALVKISGLQFNQDTSIVNLLPNETRPALRYTVANPTDFDIEVTVSTAALTGISVASWFVTRLFTSTDTSPATMLVASGALDAMPNTVALRIPAGSALTFTYDVMVSDSVGNDAQGATVSFQSILNARQV